jgi:germination protein M
MKRVALLLALVAVAAGCGGSRTSAPSTARTPAPSTTAARPAVARMPLIVYRGSGGQLEAERVLVPRTQAVARAALTELGVGVDSLSIADGTATVALSPQPAGLSLAQVVFTLTEFPSVQRVAIGGQTYDRTALDRYAPPILIAEPQTGDTVRSPVRVHGSADTFEATFVVDVLDGAGKVVARRTVTATAGSGTRGSFDVSIPFAAAPGDGTIDAYELSAENGSRIHEVQVPVQLG